MRVKHCKNKYFFLLLLISVVAGCGGGGVAPDPKPVDINQPPTVTITSPTSTAIDMNTQTTQSLDITIKADDPDGGKLNCVWTWDGGSVSPAEQTVQAGETATAKFTPPQYNGTCKLTVTVSDGEASDSKTLSVQVTGNEQPPPEGKFRITGMDVNPSTISPGTDSAITVTVENPGNKELTYSWTTRAGHISGSSSNVSWTAPSEPGIYGIYLSVSNGTDTVSTGRAITVSGSGGGLLGQYYKTIRSQNVVKLDTLAFTRVDPEVNFSWYNISPYPSKLPVEGWGASWTGFVKCEQPGTYTFRIYVDDGARARIMDDNGSWVDIIPNNTTNWADHIEGAWLPAAPVTLNLQGGKWYPIDIDFFQGADNAFAHLYWTVNGNSETLVPQSALRPPD